MAGFGLSGMAILYEMSKLKGFDQKKILVIDADRKEENDRTWSFWSNESSEYEKLACKSWNKGLFYSYIEEPLELDMGDYQYYTVRSLDFYRFIKEKLKPFNNISYQTATISAVSNMGCVVANDTTYEADLVCRSYFSKPELIDTFKKDFIWQHFKGWIIETEEPFFNEDQFTMMDYRVSEKEKIDFFYVLPFSQKHAMVEFTEFSKKMYTQKVYDSKIENYIREVMKLSDYTIIDSEYNAIPMTTAKLQLRDRKVLNIGTVAGFVKASSGYSFTRTIKFAKHLAKALMSDGNVKLPSKYGPLYKLMDSTLLQVFQDDPETGKKSYFGMFDRLKAYEIFRFLDETATLRETLSVFTVVDKPYTFTKAFFKSVVDAISAKWK